MDFLILLFAHLLADYPLQPQFLCDWKGKNLICLLSHAGIWTGCICVAGYLTGLEVTYFDIALLFSVHAIADYLKANKLLWYKNLDVLKSGLLIDQLIHVGQILIFMGI